MQQQCCPMLAESGKLRRQSASYEEREHHLFCTSFQLPVTLLLPPPLQSSLLIRALESRIPDGEVWKCLLGTGMTEERLQKEWKKKTLFLMGKAHLGLGNLQEAVDTLKASLALIAGDPALVKQADELRKLVSDAQTRRSKELRKEKAVWSKAFEKGKAPENALYSDSPEEKTPSSSAAPSPMNSPKRAVLPPGSKPQLDLDLAQFGLGPPSSQVEKKKTASKSNSSSATAAASAGVVWKPSEGTFFKVFLGLMGLGTAYWWFNRKH